MWARIKRIFRSFLGAFISIGENPELILEQNMRDMRDNIPEMNTGIAKAKGMFASSATHARGEATAVSNL